MKILVTGAAGFIGSKIAKRFQDMGHEIFAIDDLSNGKRDRISPEWKFYECELGRFALYDIFKYKIDLVIHCAAQTDVRRSMTNPLYDCDSNIHQSIWLMENMVSAGCKRIIFLSSAGALYDLKDDECCATEDSRINPICPYGISKRSFELYLDFYNHQHGIKTTILRLANVYGKDNSKGVIKIFTDWARRGYPLVLNGGDQIRDFIHVDDVVSAVEATIDREGIFNVGTGQGVSMIELADMIKSEFDQENKSEIVKNPLISGEVMRSVINPERLFKIGWKPNIPLEKGLKTVDN